MVRAILRAAVSIVAPPACAACRRPHETGGPLCGECRAALWCLGDTACPRCALPAHRARGERGCPARGASFDSAWAPFAYEGPARATVHALKLGGRESLASWMAGAMAGGVGGGSPVVVPVAPAPARRRSRGFDPAGRLAERLAEVTARPVWAGLRRHGPAARQLGAGRSARRQPGRIRVEAVGPAPALAVLVDDVHTTGATLDACAGALKAAGAVRVAAVTFARAL